MGQQRDASGTGDEPDLLEGSTIGSYQVLHRIGMGGMATVYAVRHTMIGRLLAMKVLRRDHAASPDTVQRFVNEGRAAGMLGHPNIVESTDMGLTGTGQPYIVLELLEGPLLSDEIAQQGMLPVARALHIGIQIASAMSTAHQAGIIHRDLKSDNVFLIERDGVPDHVKVIDFGISKIVRVETGIGSPTQSGIVMGTPDFMAPEALKTPPVIDERGDVYSLGAILYHMLGGRLPFEGEVFPHILSRIVLTNPPSLLEFRPTLPAQLVAVVERALAKESAARFASMDEIADALAELAPVKGRRRTQTPRPGWTLRDSATPTPVPRMPTPLPLAATQRMEAVTDPGPARPAAAPEKPIDVGAAPTMPVVPVSPETVPSPAPRQEEPIPAPAAPVVPVAAVAPAARRASPPGRARTTGGVALLGVAAVALALVLARRSPGVGRPGLATPTPREAVAIVSDPPAYVWLERAVDPATGRSFEMVGALGATPIEAARLEPASYVFVFTAAGGTTVRVPRVVKRGEPVRLSVKLPPLPSVPEGFVYVPAPDEGGAAYLISTTETTFGEWIAFLDTLPPTARTQYLPRDAKDVVQLEPTPGGKWRLVFRGGDVERSAAAGQLLTIKERRERSSLDWQQLPVSGISWEDVAAYSAWLDESGRVKGARPCTEVEWQRAARGADDRRFPHGDTLGPRDANFAATFDAPAARGPDQVGSFPRSRSPFGVDDLAGNVAEWVEPREGGSDHDEGVVRGGSWRDGPEALAVTARSTLPRQTRDAAVGFRVCADVP